MQIWFNHTLMILASLIKFLGIAYLHVCALLGYLHSKVMHAGSWLRLWFVYIWLDTNRLDIHQSFGIITLLCYGINHNSYSNTVQNKTYSNSYCLNYWTLQRNSWFPVTKDKSLQSMDHSKCGFCTGILRRSTRRSPRQICRCGNPKILIQRE